MAICHITADVGVYDDNFRGPCIRVLLWYGDDAYSWVRWADDPIPFGAPWTDERIDSWAHRRPVIWFIC